MERHLHSVCLSPLAVSLDRPNAAQPCAGVLGRIPGLYPSDASRVPLAVTVKMCPMPPGDRATLVENHWIAGDTIQSPGARTCRNSHRRLAGVTPSFPIPRRCLYGLPHTLSYGFSVFQMSPSVKQCFPEAAGV